MSKQEIDRTIHAEIVRHLSPWLVDVTCTRNRCEYSFIGQGIELVIGHEFCTHAWIEVDETWRYDDAEDTDQDHLQLVLELIGCAEVILANSELPLPRDTEHRWTPPGQGISLERTARIKKGFFKSFFARKNL